MTDVAIYARYSCDKQNETSLEDQIRRCKELAVRHGLIANDELTYTDAAVSGTDKGDAHRDGYRKLRLDWDSGKFEVLIVDEFSRLSREAIEQAVLMKRLENNRRVRLITADGIDTRDPDWQLRLGLQGLLSQHESRKLSYRVDRGMVGQLERGFMLAAPALGYDLLRVVGARGEHVGTRWVISPPEQAIVTEVFSRREAGDSMHQIAAWLNSEGVPCSRKAMVAHGGHWRAARIRAMLINPIYRGVFVWHGSSSYKAKMQAQGLPDSMKEYARPELRLVSDETWNRCNANSISRSGYGGGTHALSGLLTCGCCSATLAVSAVSKSCRTLYCAICTEIKQTTQDETRQTSAVAVAGVQVLLTHALRYFVSQPLLEAFRRSLRLRLTGDSRVEHDECEVRLGKLKAAQVRLSKMLVDISADDAVLQARYEEIRLKVLQATARLATLKAGLQVVNQEAVEAQLLIDPSKLLEGLFDAALPPQQLRAILARLFPSIVFLGRTHRYSSNFKVRFSPGTALAMAAETETVTDSEVEACFVLRYVPTSLKQKAHWEVTNQGLATPTSGSLEKAAT